MGAPRIVPTSVLVGRKGRDGSNVLPVEEAVEAAVTVAVDAAVAAAVAAALEGYDGVGAAAVVGVTDLDDVPAGGMFRIFNTPTDPGVLASDGDLWVGP